MTDLQLQDDFPDHTRADWRDLAEKGLRGAEFDTLVSRTEEGLRRGPLFDRGDRSDQPPALSRRGAPHLDGRAWHVCAPVMDADLSHANSQLLADLLGGASAVRIDSPGVRRRADLKRLLEGVYLDLVPIVFAPGCSAADYAPDMEDLQDVSVTLGLDPTGPLPDGLPKAWRAFTADASAIHEAGGSDALELAGFAAMTAEGFRRHGKALHDQISVLFAVATDAHLNIVKIRAARRLYATIARAYGIKTPTLPVHAITSLRMMQSEDAWTNLLRTMSAGFGAVTGGAEYVTIRPFTETPEERRLGNATAFSHRIARNQQLLMMEESHLGQVADPAHGSYFHETLTEGLARAAWAKFQDIEARGGITRYRSSGDLEADCEAARSDRKDRDDPVLGVTLHPAENVKAPEVRS